MAGQDVAAVLQARLALEQGLEEVADDAHRGPCQQHDGDHGHTSLQLGTTHGEHAEAERQHRDRGAGGTFPQVFPGLIEGASLRRPNARPVK